MGDMGHTMYVWCCSSSWSLQIPADIMNPSQIISLQPTAIRCGLSPSSVSGHSATRNPTCNLLHRWDRLRPSFSLAFMACLKVWIKRSTAPFEDGWYGAHHVCLMLFFFMKSANSSGHHEPVADYIATTDCHSVWPQPQKLMDTVLQGILHVICYIDDI
jgi:hypothetical protein